MVYFHVSPATVTPDNKLLSPCADPIAIWYSVIGDSVSENLVQLQSMDWPGCRRNRYVVINLGKISHKVSQ